MFRQVLQFIKEAATPGNSLKGNYLGATATLPWPCQVKGAACEEPIGGPKMSHRGLQPHPSPEEGVPGIGTQVILARSESQACQAQNCSGGMIPGGRNPDLVPEDLMAGVQRRYKRSQCQDRWCRGGTGAGRASASGASSGVNRGGPQWARGSSASVHIIFLKNK
jgi:hypothetical protein